MKERIIRLFKRQDTEANLLLYIAVFYFVFVMFYTTGDIKGDYPLILVISGLIFHIAAFLVWNEKHSVKFKDDALKRPQYFGKYKGLVYKILPVGLLLIYVSSYCFEFLRNDDKDISIFPIVLLLLTAIPMIIYFSIIGGYLRKRHLKFFWN